MFEVRSKTKGVETMGIDIRGCGRNRSFHKALNWRGDFLVVRVYAVPFFRRDRFDILLERGWDDGADYSLLTAASNYDQSVLEFSAVDAPFFGDVDEDARWEIRIENLESIKCGNAAKWGDEFVKHGRAQFDADSLCKVDAEDEHL